jgi:DNA modification methylase
MRGAIMSVRILIGDVRERLAELPADSVDCVVTSPPYWGLRDYGVEGQIGMESTLGEHLAVMVEVFDAVRRVMKPEGTLWLNYGDCYATKAAGTDDRTFRDKPFSTVGGSLKPKDLCMIPNRLAIALQEAGWWVRSEIIWGKANPMPDSAGRYRPSTAHEKIWLLTKSAASYYDAESVAQPVSGGANARVARQKMPDGWDTGKGGHGSFHRQGREKGKQQAMAEAMPDGARARRAAGFNGRGDAKERAAGVTPKSAPEGSNIRAKESFHASTTGMVDTRYLRNYEPAPVTVWPINSQAFPDAHFATFPPALVAPCIMAGCPKGGTVLDPFGGAGTTGLVADRLQRDAILIELNPDYAELARRRIEGDASLFTKVEAA